MSERLTSLNITNTITISRVETHMRTLLLSGLVLVLTLSSCTKKEEPKEQQLAAYKKERSALDDKIKQLEKELGKTTKVEGIAVTTLTMTPTQFDHVIDVKGSVDSRSSVNITPKTAGTITKIMVMNGQSVTKGQLLVELDAELVKRGIEEVKTQLDFATTLYEKQQRIYEQKAGSELQYLSAKNQKESLERRLSSLNEQLELSRMYAPTTGYIDNLIPKVGENVAPGMPIMTVVNTSDMRIVADIAESYVKTVNVGDPVTVIFAETGDTLRTKVSIVSKNVSIVNRTIRVEIPLRPVPPMVHPNMTCNVLINDISIPSALTVPLTSILRDGDATYCYTVDQGGHVVRRDVTVGLVSGSLAQITNGLAPGEHVINKGMLDVAVGQHVRVIQ